jgi:hypothetical protein
MSQFFLLLLLLWQKYLRKQLKGGKVYFGSQFLGDLIFLGHDEAEYHGRRMWQS